MEPNLVDLWYFKLWIMLDPKVKVWNIILIFLRFSSFFIVFHRFSSFLTFFFKWRFNWNVAVPLCNFRHILRRGSWMKTQIFKFLMQKMKAIFWLVWFWNFYYAVIPICIEPFEVLNMKENSHKKNFIHSMQF